MRPEDMIIDASPVGKGVGKWLMGLDSEDHGRLRDKLWRCLTEEDFVPTALGGSNGIFIKLGGVGYRVIFQASFVSKVPVVTIVRVTEVKL